MVFSNLKNKMGQNMKKLFLTAALAMGMIVGTSNEASASVSSHAYGNSGNGADTGVELSKKEMRQITKEGRQEMRELAKKARKKGLPFWFIKDVKKTVTLYNKGERTVLEAAQEVADGAKTSVSADLIAGFVKNGEFTEVEEKQFALEEAIAGWKTPLAYR